MASKTYGTLKITEAEFEAAKNLAEGEDRIAEAAYQLVRYCRGQMFNREQAEAATRMIRDLEVGKQLAR